MIPDRSRRGPETQCRIAGLRVFPIKSLDGCSVERATFGPDGGFVRDRQLALVGPDGEYVNGKRTAAVHRVTASFDLAAERVTLDAPAVADAPARVTLPLSAHDRLADWFTRYVGLDVSVRAERPSYPDDTAASGPTVVSRATLETVADWFDLPVENVRRRFRANVELGDCVPFWEDTLYDDRSHRIEVAVGDTTLYGDGPCRRCVVPARDPDTGRETPGFTERFVKRRQATLPDWSDTDRFDGAFRLAVNTVVPPDTTGDAVAVGDTVRLDGRVPVDETFSAAR